ncbi:MAG: 5'/3'-nucleotidase SurE [Myxococcales bacterium]|nr:5'/3'-nucleotidase SurE [Myxococcales bacterium]
MRYIAVPMERPLILLTNDDGVHAAGIKALQEAVRPLADVVVVAPTHEQSGMSHAVTIDRPLRHIEYGDGVHSIDGTPADCVYLALFEERFLSRRPDLVLSGINHGPNLGTSVFYSGTVAGAREAAMRGIHAMALSLEGREDSDFGPAAARTAGFVERFFEATKPEGQTVLLNINFPSELRGETRVTRVGRQIYEENVIPRRDPGGREYFWLGGRVIDNGQIENSDAQAVAEGAVSVTPLRLEATLSDHFGLAAYLAEPPE